MTTEKLLLNKKEAAQLLSLSLRTIDNLIHGRRLPVRRIGRRVLIHRRALEQFALHEREGRGIRRDITDQAV
jgi:excisionase family DNA binding protein